MEKIERLLSLLLHFPGFRILVFVARAGLDSAAAACLAAVSAFVAARFRVAAVCLHVGLQ